MPMSPHRESAQIIPFVPRARMTQPVTRDAAASVQELAPQRYPTVECGSGWYHEAAIQEEARGRRQ